MSISTVTKLPHAVGDGDCGQKNYLQKLAHQQQNPVVHLESRLLAEALETLGATGISVPDVLQPYQLHLPLYVGATTPGATTEIPHWHPNQAEAYMIVDGEVEMLAKHRWDDNGWIQKVGKGGDLLLVQPEICHWLRWRSAKGLALVFKAPQQAGVGPAAGKVPCQFCPHYQRGCMLPVDFTVNVSNRH